MIFSSFSKFDSIRLHLSDFSECAILFTVIVSENKFSQRVCVGSNVRMIPQITGGPRVLLCKFCICVVSHISNINPMEDVHGSTP